MPLRTPNNPIPAKVLLAALRTVIAPNTALTLVNASDPTGLSQVFIRSRYAMSLGLFPAVNLSTGVQQFSIVSKQSYEGGVVVNIEYYQRWDQTPQTLDTIIATTDDDMERIKANLEDNPTLAQNASLCGLHPQVRPQRRQGRRGQHLWVCAFTADLDGDGLDPSL